MKTVIVVISGVCGVFMLLIGLGMVVIYALASYNDKSLAWQEILAGIALILFGGWLLRIYKVRTGKSWEDIVAAILSGWW